MAVAFLLGSLSDLVAAIAALLTLLRIILSFLLWFVPACCLLLFLGWPMVEDRLIKPLICEKKLRSYFGASDVHIRRVRGMWSGPTITLECHDTRVSELERPVTIVVGDCLDRWRPPIHIFLSRVSFLSTPCNQSIGRLLLSAAAPPRAHNGPRRLPLAAGHPPAVGDVRRGAITTTST